jgi:hypothetical protein
MSKEYPLSVQIGEIAREIEMREHVYEGRVDRGLMRRKDADHQIGIMKEVLRTLQQLREQELCPASPLPA